MIDQEALASFASFVQAFIWRLLLYPGGLFALALALICARLIAPRFYKGVGAQPLSRAQPEWLQTAGLALSWTGWALLPLPGTGPLAWSPDLLVVLGLIVSGGLLTITGDGRRIVESAALGRGLLVGAPLLWLLAQQGAADSFGLQLAGACAAISYLVALAALLGTTDLRQLRFGGWLELFSWIALPLAFAWSTTASGLLLTAPNATGGWVAILGVALVLVLALLVTRLRVVAMVGEWIWPWGWLLFGVGMLLRLVAD